ncbi:MAG TPA: AraC family transcriptional regulator [Sphingomicrobium sp.]|nr:AraC family transcriptional regulator [Sphingomicrobium sp.]
MGIKDMIARCIERMRGGACATCDNRAVCPAGRWQQAVGPPRQERSETGGLFAFIREVVQAFSEPAAQTRCFRNEVEQSIEPLLGAGEVGIDRVARELGMSRQTLYRRLKREGITFEEILDAKRRQLSVRYLKFDRLSVKSAAYRLGFSDPAAFSRAFKRWFGVSPSDLRQASA